MPPPPDITVASVESPGDLEEELRNQTGIRTLIQTDPLNADGFLRGRPVRLAPPPSGPLASVGVVNDLAAVSDRHLWRVNTDAEQERGRPPRLVPVICFVFLSWLDSRRRRRRLPTLSPFVISSASTRETLRHRGRFLQEPDLLPS